jgi:hypothetical protein
VLTRGVDVMKMQQTNLTLLRIIIFCLIPVGAFLLYKSIGLVRKSFSGDVLLELPFVQKSATFEITESGVYSIWQKGQYFKKLPVDKFKPVIYNEATKEKLSLFPSIFRPNSNDGSTVKIELFRFSAEPGKYSIDLVEGSSITKLESLLSSVFPAKKADINKYYILVRESQPFYYILIGVPLIAISGFLMIGGLVFGILADQIFN